MLAQTPTYASRITNTDAYSNLPLLSLDFESLASGQRHLEMLAQTPTYTSGITNTETYSGLSLVSLI